MSVFIKKLRKNDQFRIGQVIYWICFPHQELINKDLKFTSLPDKFRVL